LSLHDALPISTSDNPLIKKIEGSSPEENFDCNADSASCPPTTVVILISTSGFSLSYSSAKLSTCLLVSTFILKRSKETLSLESLPFAEQPTIITEKVIIKIIEIDILYKLKPYQYIF